MSLHSFRDTALQNTSASGESSHAMANGAPQRGQCSTQTKSGTVLTTQRLNRSTLALIKDPKRSNHGQHLRMLAKLTTMSAMKRPTMPKTPPLAPTKARHVSSNAALKKLPAQAVPAQSLCLASLPRHVSCTGGALHDAHSLHIDC